MQLSNSYHHVTFPIFKYLVARGYDIFHKYLCLYSNDHCLYIILDAWWASMNVSSKRPIAWNMSRHAPSWSFDLYCGMEDTGSPRIICIVCQQVLRHPSQDGSSSMEKHLLASVYIAKLTEFIELEVSELTSTIIDETTLAIRKRQGSRGITIVSSQTKTIFHSSIFSISIQLTDKPLQTSGNGLLNSHIVP